MGGNIGLHGQSRTGAGLFVFFSFFSHETLSFINSCGDGRMHAGQSFRPGPTRLGWPHSRPRWPHPDPHRRRGFAVAGQRCRVWTAQAAAAPKNRKEWRRMWDREPVAAIFGQIQQRINSQVWRALATAHVEQVFLNNLSLKISQCRFIIFGQIKNNQQLDWCIFVHQGLTSFNRFQASAQPP